MNIEHKNDQGFSALAVAVKHQHLDIVKYLIHKGSNTNSVNKVSIKYLLIRFLG